MSESKYSHIKPCIMSFDISMRPKNRYFISRFNEVMAKVRNSEGANAYGMRLVKYSKQEPGFTTYYVTKLSCFLTYGNELVDGGFERLLIKITGINSNNLRGENSILVGADGSQSESITQILGSITSFFNFLGYYGHESTDDNFLDVEDNWFIDNVVCVQDFYVHGHPDFYIELFRKVAKECAGRPITNKKGLGWKDEWVNEVATIDFFHMKKWAKKYNKFLTTNELEPLKKKEMKACENRMRFAVKIKNPNIVAQYAYEYPSLSLFMGLLSGNYGTMDLLLDYADSVFTSGKMIFSSYNQIPDSVREESVVIDGEDFDKTFAKLFYSYKTCKGNMGQYILG